MFDNLRKKIALKNSLVMCFQCDGCMAHIHDFKWVGTVTGFEMTRFAGEAAQIKIIKRDQCGDWRDKEQGYEIVPITDGMLQKLAPNFFILFK